MGAKLQSFGRGGPLGGWGPVREKIERAVSFEDRGHGTPCWVWRGDKTNGYGRMYYAGRRWRLHRLAFEAWRGAVAEGHELDHLCRVRECCNPSHLEEVTHAENARRGKPEMVTSCPRGHAYTAENTRHRERVRKSPRTGAQYISRERDCRACHRARGGQ